MPLPFGGTAKSHQDLKVLEPWNLKCDDTNCAMRVTQATLQ